MKAIRSFLDKQTVDLVQLQTRLHSQVCLFWCFCTPHGAVESLGGIMFKELNCILVLCVYCVHIWKIFITASKDVVVARVVKTAYYSVQLNVESSDLRFWAFVMNLPRSLLRKESFQHRTRSVLCSHQFRQFVAGSSGYRCCSNCSYIFRAYFYQQEKRLVRGFSAFTWRNV